MPTLLRFSDIFPGCGMLPHSSPRDTCMVVTSTVGQRFMASARVNWSSLSHVYTPPWAMAANWQHQVATAGAT